MTTNNGKTMEHAKGLGFRVLFRGIGFRVLKGLGLAASKLRQVLEP